MTEPQSNWAGNYQYKAARWHRPETVAGVQEIAARCKTLKVLGTRHSFNGIADTTEDMVSLAHFDKVLALDEACRTVTVGAGIRYGELGQALYERGWAIHNLASLPHISVAGACATATHGSGDGNGNLATAICGLELVTANGDLVSLSREQDGELFQGAVVGLGALGVVVHLTLAIEPAFHVRQDVYENLSLADLEADFDAITSSAYSVSLFTDWQAARFHQVWRKSRVAENDARAAELEWHGATLAHEPRHPLPDHSAINCTAQQGVPGPWHERLPHFRMEFTPSSGEELQTEYLLPRRHACAAFHALLAMRDAIAPHLMVSEIRTVAADELWLSPNYRQDSVAIHFTWQKDWPAVSGLLPQVEARLAPFAARPHWGKLFTTPPAQIRALYPKMLDFQRLIREFDPTGKFRNAFLDTYIAGAD